MQTHNLIQGSPEWDQFRLDHFGASEAAAMLGLSSNVTRNELLKMKHTGIAKEYSDWVENVLFANGHEVEAMARPIIEDMIGDELYPVTCTDGKLSASCDGLTMDESVAFEHKQWNEQLAASIGSGLVPDEYMSQCQQVLMVTGAEKLIFVTSDGTEDNFASTPVYPDESWFKKLRDGWHRFKLDLEDYKPREITEKPEADAIMQLPALSIQIKGEVTTSNLPQFKEAAETFISNIKTDLQTDEDFANAESTVKFCADTEKKIELAKDAAIAQTSSIDDLMRTMDHIKDSLRVKRLALEKLVKTQKETIKNKIIDDAYELARDHVGNLASEIKLVKFHIIADSLCMKRDFIQSTKNKRTLSSLHNAVDTYLAEVKINLDATAKDIREKIAFLVDTNHEWLFPDIQQIITKSNDDFKLLVETRISDHKNKVAEETKKKIDAEKEAEERETLAKENEERRIEEAKKEEARRIEAKAEVLRKAKQKNALDRNHQEKIALEAITSLDERFDFLNKEMASAIVTAIADNKIKNLVIIF